MPFNSLHFYCAANIADSNYRELFYNCIEQFRYSLATEVAT